MRSGHTYIIISIYVDFVPKIRARIMRCSPTVLNGQLIIRTCGTHVIGDNVNDADIFS